jgi:hypothetical protein
LARSFETLGYLDSIQIRHRDVEDNYIRLQFPGPLQSRPAVISFTNYVHICLRVNKRLQSCAHDRMIIG